MDNPCVVSEAHIIPRCRQHVDSKPPRERDLYRLRRQLIMGLRLLISLPNVHNRSCHLGTYVLSIYTRGIDARRLEYSSDICLLRSVYGNQAGLASNPLSGFSFSWEAPDRPRYTSNRVGITSSCYLRIMEDQKASVVQRLLRNYAHIYVAYILTVAILAGETLK